MLAYYIKKARRMSAGEFLQRSSEFAARRLAGKKLKFRDKYYSTYTKNTDITIQPVCYKDLAKCSVPQYSCELADLYMRHYFDLLGSGWVHNGFGEKYAGCEGCCYDMQMIVEADREGEWLAEIVPENCLQDAMKIWQQVSIGYQPVNWQVDFKSGYSWSAKTWYMDVEYGHLPGVDIKVPWELARMQHLIQYVYAYMMAADNEKMKYVQEFQDEIFDFIAQNPPRYGVNWRCTMDVGIRVANWLMAYDLFCSLGVRFSADFSKVLAASVYAHGRHIVHNLEYSPQLTSNHYLSDIGGLLFASMHLESTPETDAWLAFAIQELAVEMKKQFHADGSNFEASTSYHCLSTEIMLHCALLCRHIPVQRRKKLKDCDAGLIKNGPGLMIYNGELFDVDNNDVFNEEFWQRLCRALQFVGDVSGCDGCIQQIGDADSGRFLKLETVFHIMRGGELKKKYINLKAVCLNDEDVYYDEDLLNHSHLFRALMYLTHGGDMDMGRGIEKMIVCQRCHVENIAYTHNLVGSGTIMSDKLEDILSVLPDGYAKVEYEFISASDLTAGLIVKAYSGMGLYVYQSAAMKMLVRCGEIGQNGNGGHAHNDQLSVCLNLDGEDVVRDCGSYLYTASPEMRNKFRSTFVHFTPQAAGQEQNLWEMGARGLFSMLDDRTRAKALYCGCDGMVMQHDGFGDTVYRIVQLEKHRVCVTDYGRNLIRWQRPAFWSNGYGKLMEY